MASTFISLPNDSTVVDGNNHLKVNPDGSINVVEVASTIGSATYDEVLSVASGVTTTICSYTEADTSGLLSVEASGTNIAAFFVDLNGSVLSKKYTNFGSELSVTFNFTGLLLSAGDIVRVRVLHSRPSTGDFNATIYTQG